jgi:hypothetical protein
MILPSNVKFITNDPSLVVKTKDTPGVHKFTKNLEGTSKFLALKNVT